MNVNIGIHILQNFSYSNLNRDESGAPKSTIVGGTRRQRVSSQCLKRAVRKEEAFRIPLEGHLGSRTRLFPELFVACLLRNNKIPAEHHDKLRAKAAFFASNEGGTQKKQKDGRVRTAQAIYLGAQESEALAARYEQFFEEEPGLFALWLDPASTLKEAVINVLGDDLEGAQEELFEELAKRAFVLVDKHLDEFAAFGTSDPPAIKVSLEGAEWIVGVAREALESERHDEFIQLLSKKMSTGGPKMSSEMKARLKGRDQKLKADLGLSHLSADLALFGRMTTAMPALVDVEGALSVADAISTNEMTLEVDYFTAMDDHDDGHSAAHVGEQFGTSNCLYRCAVLSWDVLLDNLKHDESLALATLEALLRGVVLALPAAKRRAHAHYVTPEAILIEITGRPTSYVNAFVEPVRAAGGNLVENSMRKLGTYAHQQRTVFNVRGDRFWLNVDGGPLLRVEKGNEIKDLPSHETLDQLVESVVKCVQRVSADRSQKGTRPK